MNNEKAAAPVQAQEPVDWQEIALFYQDLYSKEKHCTPAQDSSVEKSNFWFDCLYKCAKLLELDDHTPIPSGVVSAVEKLVSARVQPVAVPDGAGTPSARLNWILIELARIFPDAGNEYGSAPSEIAYFEKIVKLAAQTAQGDAKDTERWRAFERSLRTGHFSGAGHGRRFKIVEICPMYGNEKEFNDFVGAIDAAIAAKAAS